MRHPILNSQVTSNVLANSGNNRLSANSRNEYSAAFSQNALAFSNATALGNQACRRGYTTIFIGIHELIEKLEIARTEGSYLRLRDRLIKTDCLILDDLGIKKLPASVVQDLYDILEERFATRSTIITSQIPLENWKEVIEDPVALEAILDRLIHGAVRLKLEGESMRKKRIQTKGVDSH